MKKLILFALIFSSFYACNTNTDTENEDISVQENTVEANNQYCFLNTIVNEPIKVDGKIVQEMIDSTILSFTIEDGKAKGIYSHLPAQQDQRMGSFVGEVSQRNNINGIYSFAEEGEDYTTGFIIEMNKDEAKVSLVDINITKTETATVTLIEKPIILKKVNCD